LVGTSEKSWEKGANLALETATETLSDLTMGEVISVDMTVENVKGG